MKRSILIILLLVVVVIQFIPALPENSEEVADQSFVKIHDAPAKVESILRISCYDCHSNTATWPWYAHVAPVNFWLADHVEHGRKHLNFSEWASYDAEKRDHKLEEIVEMVEEKEMPLESYTWLHSKADLTAEQRRVLIDFAQSLRN